MAKSVRKNSTLKAATFPKKWKGKYPSNDRKRQKHNIGKKEAKKNSYVSSI